jgi:hypothetical protein
MALLTLADLRAIEPNIDADKAQAYIQDALSYAVIKVPGLLAALTHDQQDAARGILREQVLRRYHNGDGNVQQQSAGPFTVTVDSRTTLAPIVSDHAIERLKQVVGTSTGGAFSVVTTPGGEGTTYGGEPPYPALTQDVWVYEDGRMEYQDGRVFDGNTYGPSYVG